MEVAKIIFDPGSFRDPEGSVFFFKDSVYRTFSKESLPKIKSLLETDFFKEFVERGEIIKTNLIKNEFGKEQGIDGEQIIQHELIPFMTYPYEWSFSMLKDAALLTLNILKKCLQNGFILKDGTSWNVTYHKSKMVFFDVLSIDHYQDGQTWDGYNQFCKEFLYPLLLKSYKDIDFQIFFKGSLSGIDSHIARQMFSVRDFFKPGIFKHVFLNAKLSQNKKISAATVKNKFQLPKEALIGIVEGLIKVVEGLKNKTDHSVWIDYAKNNTYEDEDEKQKKLMVEKFCQNRPHSSRIIDIGCNTGTYSFVASKRHSVISCDIDSDCIDTIYKKIKLSTEPVSPLVLNLMNLSASCGWNLHERKSILERLKTDGFLALALIHHICIANNVPIDRFIAFLRQISTHGVLEWVSKEDPMVQFLLRNRKDVFENYTWDFFEKSINKHFKITDAVSLNNGTRTLCILGPKE